MNSERGRTPPRLPAAIFQRIGGRRATYMLRELDEEFSRFVVPERGSRRARTWYWLQIARSIPSILRPDPRGAAERRGVFTVLSMLHRDVRLAVRSLVTAPRYSIAVILTLGVGVGAGMSVFSLVDLLLLRSPAHIEEPDRVRRLTIRQDRPPFGQTTSTSLAWIDYEAMRDAATTLDGVAAYFTTNRSLGRGMGARHVTVSLASPTFFTVLGVRPVRGRFFQPDEDVPGLNPVPCVASDAFWRRELRAADTLGQEVQVGSIGCVIVGVAPAGFNGIALHAVEIWIPIRPGVTEMLGWPPAIWTSDGSRWVRVLARLAPGVDEERAEHDATLAYRSIADRVRDPELQGVADWQSIMPGSQTRRSVIDISLLLLAGGIVLLLLIAMNLANLLVVREIGRDRDTAIHIALGISPWRLFVGRGVEIAMLATIAGLVGLGIAASFGPIVRATLVTNVDFAAASVTVRVGLLTVGVALVVGLLIGTASTIRLRARDPSTLLTSATSARSGSGPRGQALRLAFVAVQAALSAALLVASIAFVTSFRRATTIDLGFDRHGVMAASVELADLGYTREERWTFYQNLRERLTALPGIESVSLGYMTPWWTNRIEPVRIPGRDTLPPVAGYGQPVFDAVTPDYLRTLGLTMRTGRWIEGSDTRGAGPVVVINEALRDLYWPAGDPIGACLRIGEGEGTPCRTVVGVVANHRFTGGLEDPPVPAYFLPLEQAAGYTFTPRLFARAVGDVEEMMGPVRRMVQGQAPNLPAAQLMVLNDTFEPLVSPWRLGSYAFTALGVLAMIVATLGLFSILSYVVTERRREFALRAAVGAAPGQIVVPVVRQGLATVAFGIAAGFGVVLGVSGWLEALLFRTRLADPLALCAAAVLSLAVAALASLAPARAAASRSPMEILRTE